MLTGRGRASVPDTLMKMTQIIYDRGNKQTTCVLYYYDGREATGEVSLTREGEVDYLEHVGIRYHSVEELESAGILAFDIVQTTKQPVSKIRELIDWASF